MRFRASEDFGAGACAAAQTGNEAKRGLVAHQHSNNVRIPLV